MVEPYQSHRLLFFPSNLLIPLREVLIISNNAVTSDFKLPKTNRGVLIFVWLWIAACDHLLPHLSPVKPWTWTFSAALVRDKECKQGPGHQTLRPTRRGIENPKVSPTIPNSYRYRSRHQDEFYANRNSPYRRRIPRLVLYSLRLRVLH